MKTMRRQTSDVYEDILKLERERLLAVLNPSHVQIWADDVPSRNDEVAHDQSLSVAVNELELHKLRQVDAALKRLRDGTYGMCEICGQSISEKRLQALPWADACLTCAIRPEVRSDTARIA